MRPCNVEGLRPLSDVQTAIWSLSALCQSRIEADSHVLGRSEAGNPVHGPASEDEEMDPASDLWREADRKHYAGDCAGYYVPCESRARRRTLSVRSIARRSRRNHIRVAASARIL